MNEVLNAIQARRSTRGFSDVQLTDAEFQVLVDAALASPTARNTQMWHFSVVQNKELLDEFCREAAELMQKNTPAGARGRFDSDSFHMFYHAPTVIFISRPEECDNSFVDIDCGIACENIALAAQGIGLGSVIIGLAKPLFMSELRRILAEPFLPAEAAEQTEKKADFAGKRLLVVEDNALNREIAVTMLEEGGFEVDTAENGKVAVDKVRESAPGYYDLVLMDIQMPVMNGYEATRAIRALPDAKKAALPIVAITANAFDEDRQNAAKAGMNGHLSKPFDMQQLLAMIEEVL